MKKAVRWKSKAYGIFYWHDSAVRWKPEPYWIEDRNLLLHRLYEARFYYPESKDDIKIVKPSKSAQKLELLKNELVTWMGKCSYLEDQVAELLLNEMKLEEALKLAQDRSYDKLMAEMDRHGPGCEAGWSLVADCSCEVEHEDAIQVEMDSHGPSCEAGYNLANDCTCATDTKIEASHTTAEDPVNQLSDEDLDLIFAPECCCFIKDNDKPQRYHVLACPLSGYKLSGN